MRAVAVVVDVRTAWECVVSHRINQRDRLYLCKQARPCPVYKRSWWIVQDVFGWALQQEGYEGGGKEDENEKDYIKGKSSHH